jgi:hypothetical protein
MPRCMESKEMDMAVLAGRSGNGQRAAVNVCCLVHDNARLLVERRLQGSTGIGSAGNAGERKG